MTPFEVVRSQVRQRRTKAMPDARIATIMTDQAAAATGAIEQALQEEQTGPMVAKIALLRAYIVLYVQAGNELRGTLAVTDLTRREEKAG